MTTLTLRPGLAIALVDESAPTDLSERAREDLRLLMAQIVEMTLPLTRVRSLSAAEKLVTSIAPAYEDLVMRWEETLSNVSPDVLMAIMEKALAASMREAHLFSDAVQEQLRGVIQSSDAYFAWFAHTCLSPLEEDEEQSVAALIAQTRDSVVRGEIALNAVESILTETADSVPGAIPILVELADRYWTEVEDHFLSLAEYDDEGDTVPLSKVKAELGL